MGNATWPAFTEERARVDVSIVKQNGIDMVVANGNGFSAFDHMTKVMKKPGKKVWRIKKGASLPPGLRLVKDRRPGHEGALYDRIYEDNAVEEVPWSSRRARTR